MFNLSFHVWIISPMIFTRQNLLEVSVYKQRKSSPNEYPSALKATCFFIIIIFCIVSTGTGSDTRKSDKFNLWLQYNSNDAQHLTLKQVYHGDCKDIKAPSNLQNCDVFINIFCHCCLLCGTDSRRDRATHSSTYASSLVSRKRSKCRATKRSSPSWSNVWLDLEDVSQ